MFQLPDNCSAAVYQNGSWTSIKLDVQTLQTAKYRLSGVTYLPQTQSGGKRVAKIIVRDANGKDVHTKNVLLSWPDGNALLNDAQKMEHVIGAGFSPAREVGSYSIAVVDDNKKIISEVLHGLGLPDNQHVYFLIEFAEINAQSTPIPPDVNDKLKQAKKLAEDLLKVLS